MDFEGSMLAEPRYKVKPSPDPRGTFWGNDETKYGKRMLERMGWSKGKGLGAKEDGMKEHIKVTLKNDTRGLGCSVKQADYWQEHQDSFNALLQSLSQEGSGSNNASPAGSDTETTKVSSLEHKSKTSRARLHYQKFTRGKDLSNRSDHDLACIFGRKKDKKSKKEEETESVKEEEEKAVSQDGKQDNSHGVTTIQRELSVQEYFKMKMEQRRLRSSGAVEAPTSSESVSNSHTSSPEPNSHPRLRSEDAGSAVTSPDAGSTSLESCGSGSKKAKKSKKRKRKDTEDEEIGDQEQPAAAAETVEAEECSTRKKRKKDKKRKVEEESCENQDPETLQCSPPPSCEPKKRKKRKSLSVSETAEEHVINSSGKKSKRVSFAETLVQSVTVDEMDDSMSTHCNGNDLAPEDTSNSKTSKKDKKKNKKKKDKLLEANDENGTKDAAAEDSQAVGPSVESEAPSEDLASLKKSKKKKKKKELVEASSEVNGAAEEGDGGQSEGKEGTREKGKKKKEKKKKEEELTEASNGVSGTAEGDDSGQNEETKGTGEKGKKKEKKKKKEEEELAEASNGVSEAAEEGNCGGQSEGVEGTEEKKKKKRKALPATLTWRAAANSVQGYCNMKVES